MSRLMMIAAKITAIKSHRGKLHQTPQIGESEAKKLSGDEAKEANHWNNNGMSKIHGISNITWRVRLKKIALLAIPIEV